MSVTQLKTKNDCGSFQINDQELVLIPEGKYEVGFLYYETRYLHNRSPKLVVWFNIVTMGEHFEKKIARFYNIKRIIGKPCKGGKFEVGWKSNFLREFCSIVDEPVKRLDRIAMTKLRNHIIKAKIKTVKKGHDQIAIPEALQYSVIERLLSRSE